MLWHEFFRNLYWDLCIVEEADNGLDGSFSSGQVAEPLGKDSTKYSWLREKLAGEERGRTSCELLSETRNPHPFSEPPYFIPHQGIATDALAVKCS